MQDHSSVGAIVALIVYAIGVLIGLPLFVRFAVYGPTPKKEDKMELTPNANQGWLKHVSAFAHLILSGGSWRM